MGSGSYGREIVLPPDFRKDFLEQGVTKLSPERQITEIPSYLGRENRVGRGPEVKGCLYSSESPSVRPSLLDEDIYYRLVLDLHQVSTTRAQKHSYNKRLCF